MTKKFFTWSDLERMVENLALEIISSKRPIKCISGLPRGGLAPAVMLSHRLNLPYVNINALMHDYAIRPKDALIVDDICDSGATLKQFNDKGFTTLTLHAKPGAITTPDFYGNFLQDRHEWIVYPWESKIDTNEGGRDDTLGKQLLKG